ncbi:MAG: transposase family protein [Rhodocyclaceae bacterium]|nr:transposase family protein [Rhodocyclaceae bacterium]MBK7814132.1 transposase family protein [Rhodocyclaceae bacterium]
MGRVVFADTAVKVEHDLVELLVVAVNAVLVGADTFVEIKRWAKEKLDWLRSYRVLSCSGWLELHAIALHWGLAMPFGSPQNATMNRLFPPRR